MPSDTPNPEIPDRPELKGQVARGAVWVMGAGLLARVLGTLNTIIVARLLVPEDIGLVAVATIAMQMLQGFSDIGVSQTVVKFQDANRDDLDTLFTLSVVRGLIIGAVLAGFAPLAASIYGDPRMLGVFLGVSLFPVITGFINPRFYEFERALNFSREFISSVGNKLAGVIVSVGVALVFRTYWAIILGLLAGGVVQLALSYIMAPHRPRITFRSFRKVFGFTGWLAGVSFVAALNNKLDVPILARLVGAGGRWRLFHGRATFRDSHGTNRGPVHAGSLSGSVDPATGNGPNATGVFAQRGGAGRGHHASRAGLGVRRPRCCRRAAWSEMGQRRSRD